MVQFLRHRQTKESANGYASAQGAHCLPRTWKFQCGIRSISGGGSIGKIGDGGSLRVGSIRSERDYALSGGKDSISQPQNRIFDYLRHRDPNYETSNHMSQKPLVRPLRNV